MGYRNMLEKVAERYHTTPQTIVALNGPDKLIGPGQTLRLPNVVPAVARLWRRHQRQAGAAASNMLNVERRPAAGRLCRRRQERRHAQGLSAATHPRRMAQSAKRVGQLVAQFPVTTGSSHDPLPLGTWKVTTYSLPAAVQLPARPVLGRRRRQGRAEAAAGAERPGRRRLARPHQGALRHPRHQRAADHRPHRKPRLPAPDQLGRDAAVADDEAGLHRGISWPRRRMFRIIATAFLTAVVTSFFWIWFYGIVPQPTAGGRAQRQCRDRRARPARRRWRSRSRSRSGPPGLAIPVVGHQGRPAQSTPTTQARGAGAPPRCDRHHGRARERR